MFYQFPYTPALICTQTGINYILPSEINQKVSNGDDDSDTSDTAQGQGGVYGD